LQDPRAHIGYNQSPSRRITGKIICEELPPHDAPASTKRLPSSVFESPAAAAMCYSLSQAEIEKALWSRTPYANRKWSFFNRHQLVQEGGQKPAATAAAAAAAAAAVVSSSSSTRMSSSSRRSSSSSSSSSAASSSSTMARSR
jgi:hypothetical protein